MSQDIEKISAVLDRLTLDALTLMEEQIQTKLNVENAMCNGETHLAKSRYILGHNKVSALQLPGENSPDFAATAVVNSEESPEVYGQKVRELEIVKREEQSDPVRWFGYLVTQDMYRAQSMFKQALVWVVKAANLQTKFVETCDKIAQVKELKKELISQAT